MKEKKTKPWITDQWQAAGWDGKTDVWRLEFRIKSTTKKFKNADTGNTISLKDMDCLEWNNIVDLYKILFNKYFRFVINNGQGRKDRMEEIKFFPNFEAQCIMIDLSSKTDGTISNKIQINRMMKDRIRLKPNDYHLERWISDYLVRLIEEKGLWDWFKVRWPNYILHDSALRKLEERNVLMSCTSLN